MFFNQWYLCSTMAVSKYGLKLELFWGEIKDSTPCQHLAKLEELIWVSITPDVTIKLVNSMPRHCQVVITAHGGLTKYTCMYSIY